MSGVNPMMSWIATIAGQPRSGAAPSGRHSRARISAPLDSGTRSSVSTAIGRRYHAPTLNFDPRRADTRVMRWALLLVAALAAAWWWWSDRGIPRPPGVLAPNDPVQENVRDGPHWEIAGYDLQGLASIEVNARVLSAERYRSDREA